MKSSTQTFVVLPRAERLAVSFGAHELDCVRRVAASLRCSSGALVRAAVVEMLEKHGFNVRDTIEPNGRLPKNRLDWGGTD